MSALVDYYSRRAPEYDAVYRKPERQADLRRLGGSLARTLAGHDVLELASGTGYWTARYAGRANSVLGVDASRGMLGIAQNRLGACATVRFQCADVFSLPAFGRDFSACFCGFFWSHIPLAQTVELLAGLRRALPPETLVVLTDNRYVEGSSTPVARIDSEGNTWQIRALADGSRHEVLKNFPSPEELRETLSPVASDITIELLDYFWIATFRLLSPPTR